VVKDDYLWTEFIMSTIRTFSIILAGLSIISLTASRSVPAHAQNNFIGVISKLIQEQRALKERRRQEALAVTRMQLALKALGYYDGSVDGDFGEGTQAALKEYRRSVGRSEYEGLSLEEVQEIEVKASEEAAKEPEPVPTPPASDQRATVLVRADLPKRLDTSLSNAAGWIVIASRETPEEAISVAQEYVQLFTSTTVIKSSNGRYAIVAGWLNRDRGRPLKDALIARNLIPDDTFLSSGDRFEPPVWSVNGQLIHSRADLLNYALIRPTAALLSQLGNGPRDIVTFGSRVAALPKATDYLSLRVGNSTSAKEVRRLPQGTLLKVTNMQNGWLQVQLLNGMSGWVSAEYVTQSGEEGSVDPTPPVTEKEPSPSTDEKQTAPPGPDVAEQQRRSKLTKESMMFLDDLAVYLRLHPELPEIGSIAEEFAELQQAIQENNFTAIDATTQSLKKRMSDVSDYGEFRRGRIEERREAEIKALGDAVSLASKHKQFLRMRIAESIGSPDASTFAGFLKRYELALASAQPDLAILTNLNEGLKQVVSEKGLTALYEREMTRQNPTKEPHADASNPSAPKTEAKRDGSTPTDRNRFLMEGDLGDWVFIFNASGKAPNVVRNIRGDIVFENETAKTCVLHPNQQKIEQADVEAILTAYSVENVQFDSRPCPESDLQNYDVLIALRGEWLKQPPSYMAPLLGQIEDRKFQELKTLTKAAFEDRKKNDTAESIRRENEIAKGTRSGYGLVKIENGASSICLTTSDDMQDAQVAMLADNNKMLSRIFGSAPETMSRTVEAAFRDAKRGECGAIFGERGDLWDAIQGFRRDNVSYSVVPLWFDSKLVAERAEQIRVELASEAQTTQNQKRG